MYKTTTETASCQAVLHDISGSGREQPWVQHKSEATVLALAYDVSGDHAKATRVRACADALHFVRREDGRLKLKVAAFCRVRLCPICQWRRSLKVYGQTTQVVRYLAEHCPYKSGYSYVMLTLTQRTVPAAELPGELDRIHRAWQRMTQTTAYRRAVCGSIRATEITRSKDGTYHPHIHAILCVRGTYFKSRDYISQQRWADMWQTAARLDYTPVVDIRKCYGSAEAAVAEVAKYAAKPGDYIDPSDIDGMVSTVQDLDGAVSHRRFVSWGGCMAAAHKALQLDDTESGDLIHTDTPDDAAEDSGILSFDWTPGVRLYLRR